MRLRLLIIATPLILPLAGCVIHFPLDENVPTLASQDPESLSNPGGQTATETNMPDVGNENSADTPDTPR